jgi:hypothetical protein
MDIASFFTLIIPYIALQGVFPEYSVPFWSYFCNVLKSNIL